MRAMKLKTTHLLNDGVISQWRSSFVQLAISTFVDQLLWGGGGGGVRGPVFPRKSLGTHFQKKKKKKKKKKN